MIIIITIIEGSPTTNAPHDHHPASMYTGSKEPIMTSTYDSLGTFTRKHDSVHELSWLCAHHGTKDYGGRKNKGKLRNTTQHKQIRFWGFRMKLKILKMTYFRFMGKLLFCAYVCLCCLWWVELKFLDGLKRGSDGIHFTWIDLKSLQSI